MEICSVMVTGANRGIGLEFVRQLVKLPKPPRYVFATYRSEDTLQDLKKIQKASTASNVILIKMDVRELREVELAKKIIQETVGEKGLNLLINNAGVLKTEGFPAVTPENIELHFKVNTVGPVRIFQTMLSLLEKAALHVPGPMRAEKCAVLNIASSIGSISHTGSYYPQSLALFGYKVSKAALNMAMKVISSNVKDKEIMVVLMCPGWVKTDMGTSDAEIEPEESVKSMLQTVATLNVSNHGSFMDRNGNVYPF